MNLEEFKALGKKGRRKRLSNMTDEEKFELVDAIIDRDAAVWKEYVRSHPYDVGYYLSHIDGLALTERQR